MRDKKVKDEDKERVKKRKGGVGRKEGEGSEGR